VKPAGNGQLYPPTTGGVRPVRDVEPLAPSVERTETLHQIEKLTPPIGDDDPRAAHNFRDDGSAYPSANAKKKDLATSRKTRSRPASTKPVRAPVAADEPRSVPDISPATPVPPKKTNTLDLFNDTK
jgi:hypothetical protein